VSGWTIAWLCWGAYFAAVEGFALANSRTGDTLSEHVWSFLGLRRNATWNRTATGWTKVRRVAVGLFMVALGAHFLIGSNAVGNGVLIATSIILALVVAGTGAVRYLRRSKSPRRLTMATLSTKPPFILRARKAFAAGAAAAAGAFFTSFVAETPKTRDGWIALVAASVGVGVAAGWSVYKVRNSATVEGSDPPGITYRAG
jgi:hypothetical protein